MLPFPPALITLANSPAVPLQAWLGPNLEAQSFKSFAAARQADLAAGAQEPYRTWLFGLMASQTNHLRKWAATRLVEAGAAQHPGDLSPDGILMDACLDLFHSAVILGNTDQEHQQVDSENPPMEWQALGRIAELQPNSTCWGKWRSQLRDLKAPSITLGFYALFAPNLEPQDEGWVHAALKAAAATPSADPRQSPAFLLATDWLMLYGQETQWQAFQETCTAKTWRKTLQGMAHKVGKVPLFWTRAAVPDPLAPSAAARVVPPKVSKTTFLLPEYPKEASGLGFTSDTRVRVTLDGAGHILQLRLAPGYALGVFGPDALAWVGRWTFEGAKVDDQPAPSVFLAKVPFVRPGQTGKIRAPRATPRSAVR